VFKWRNALIMGVIFVTIGTIYYVVQGTGNTIDRTGVTLLLMLGVAMSFGFAVLLRAAREL
jgi:hypothetical protein